MENQNGKSLRETVYDTNEAHMKPAERNSADNGVSNRKTESHGENVQAKEGKRYSNSETPENSASSMSLNRTGEIGVTDAAKEGLNLVKLKYRKPVKGDERGDSRAAQEQKLGESQTEEGSANPQERSSKSSQHGVESTRRGKGDVKKKSKSKRRRVISVVNQVKLPVNTHSDEESRDTGGFEVVENKRGEDGGVGLDGKRTKAVFVKEKKLEVTVPSPGQERSERAESRGSKNTQAGHEVLPESTNATSRGSGQRGEDDHDETAPRKRTATSHEEQQEIQNQDGLKEGNHIEAKREVTRSFSDLQPFVDGL